MTLNKKAIGIDLGTTNSVIATLEAGKPEVLVNSEGNRTTPSVVAFTKDGERLVGSLAKRQATLNPLGTLFSVKRFMGRRRDEVESEMMIVPYGVAQDKDGAVRLEVEEKQYAPEEISAQVIRKLVSDASSYLGEKVTDAVITVPAYFNDAQRQATRDAGKIAGVNVLRVINEPTAAALAYGLDKKDEQKILVFDLGGGTFDVSILEIGEGVCEVLSTSGDTHLGGDDFDKILVDWIADEFQKEQGIDLRNDRQSLQRLYEAAEKAKCELSSATSADISLPFITADATGPKHLQMSLTRAKFDNLTRSLIERTTGPVETALKDANLSSDKIDEVILVGGSTRIPAVQAEVKRLTRKDPNMTVNPDEVVAMGAAVQAGIIGGDVDDVLLLDVIPLSLGVETMGGVMTTLIEKNTTVPFRKGEIFSTAADDQPAVDIVVLQGEREMAADNRVLGTFKLDGIRKAPRGIPQIEVAFDVDANGILTVSASDKDTGKEQKITISNSTNLDKSEVDRMMREASDNASEDKRRREMVDAKNELESMAYRVNRAVSETGDTLPEHLRARAQTLTSDAESVIKNIDAGLDEIRSLQGELTQVLAAIQSGTGNDTGGSEPGPDDVIDAEFTN